MNAPTKLRTPEAAAYLGLSASTLEKYRLSGFGPVYSKGMKIVIYDVEDLDLWLHARRRTSTSDVGPPATNARSEDSRATEVRRAAV